MRIKTALLPVIIAVSSIVTGIVWGYIAEKMLYHESGNLKSVYPLAVMFLSFPFVNEFGFDFFFIAVGIGVYNGIFSKREKTILELSYFSPLIIFSLFGMHLSMEDVILLDNIHWKLVAVFVSFFIFSRMISTRLSMHFISPGEVRFPSLIYFIPCGPMALILLHTYMQRFTTPVSEEINTSNLYSVLTTSMILLFIIFIVVYLVLRLLNEKNALSKSID
jgi:hypothetical protein